MKIYILIPLFLSGCMSLGESYLRVSNHYGKNQGISAESIYKDEIRRPVLGRTSGYINSWLNWNELSRRK